MSISNYNKNFINSNKLIPPVWYGGYPIYYDVELGEKIYNKMKIMYEFIIKKIGKDITDIFTFINKYFNQITLITYKINYN